MTVFHLFTVSQNTIELETSWQGVSYSANQPQSPSSIVRRKTVSVSTVSGFFVFPGQDRSKISTRQAMCVSHNIEARSHNHCRRGKTKIITYSECISVA